MHLESEGGERRSPGEKQSLLSARRALVDHPSAITGNTAGYDYPSHRLWHAHVRRQYSLHAAPEHNR
jgi:hypothetical protein